MKRLYLSTFLTCLVVTVFFAWRNRIWDFSREDELLKVGLICESDESGPYTYNFTVARTALEEIYGKRVQVMVRRNILDSEVKEPVTELVKKGCRILFYNGHSSLLPELARSYPETEFCQVTCFDPSGIDLPSNYHTFNGLAWQGEFVSGVVAGYKLKNMIGNYYLSGDDALVGFIAPFERQEVISGYTAFLLGIRSVVPEARMKVIYTNAWSSYSAEKECARKLIREGCTILSHFTDTSAAAAACEEAAAAGSSRVFFVGYNDSMIDVAPTTSLIGAKINWIPYITQASQAVMEGKRIEEVVQGTIHGTDISGGFEHGWIEMVDLNPLIAVNGTQAKIDETISALKRNSVEVFKGDYIGIDPRDTEDQYDLNAGYKENDHSSMPTFHYILRDVIETEYY